jgi:HK97 family phage prohead protease
MKMEYRKLGEIRSSTEEGIVDAYLTAWGTVDSYNTTFQRGCFKRTFEERGHKIRLLWNHERLAGKVTECREDDYGPFVRVQFNLDTQVGREAFAHVRDGDVDAFSFGFNVIKDNWESGIRSFEEIKVMECGPVVFEANEAAKITDARAEDFDETFGKNELHSRGWKLFYALEDTIDDIFWNNNTPDEVKSKIDECISKFHGAYMQWLTEWYQQFEERASAVKYLARPGNKIQEAVKNTENIETITRETSLTDSDLDRLKSGKLLTREARAKLSELPENIREAHQAERRNTVEALCAEIRESGFNEAEKQRFSALLGLAFGHESVRTELSETLSFIKNLRQSIN